MNRTAFQNKEWLQTSCPAATGGEVGIASPHKKGKETHHFQADFCLKKAGALITKNKNVKRRFQRFVFGLCYTAHPVADFAMAEGHFAMQTKFDHLIFELAQDFCFLWRVLGRVAGRVSATQVGEGDGMRIAEMFGTILRIHIRDVGFASRANGIKKDINYRLSEKTSALQFFICFFVWPFLIDMLCPPSFMATPHVKLYRHTVIPIRLAKLKCDISLILCSHTINLCISNTNSEPCHSDELPFAHTSTTCKG